MRVPGSLFGVVRPEGPRERSFCLGEFSQNPQRATGNSCNMATTETRAAFARRHGVNRSTVGRWEAKGSIVLTVDGLVNVEASEQLLGGRAETYRGGRAKGPSAQKLRRRPTQFWMHRQVTIRWRWRTPASPR